MNQNTKPIDCCQLNDTFQEIYNEQVTDKKGYTLGYYTTYYYLLKELKKTEQLCGECQKFAEKIWEIIDSKELNFKN